MKIVFIENSSQKGGSLKSLCLIAECLKKDARVFRVFSNYENGDIDPLEGVEDIFLTKRSRLFFYLSALFYKLYAVFKLEPIRRCAYFFEFSEINKYKAAVTPIKPDVIVYNNPPHIDHIAMKAFMHLNVTKVCHLRLLRSDSIYIDSNLSDVISNGIDAFVSGSFFVKDSWVKRWPGITNKVHVIPNSVPDCQRDGSAFKDLINKDLDGKYKVACVGRLVSYKGQEVALEAVSNCKLRNDIELFFIGDGPDFDRLCKIIKEKGMSDQVHMVNYLKSAQNYISFFDLILVPTRGGIEAFGNVVIEAMQQSVCVVATNSAGPAEIINHGVDGLLFESDDFVGLSFIIDKILTDHVERDRLAKSGRDKYLRDYSPDIFSREIRNLYFRNASS